MADKLNETEWNVSSTDILQGRYVNWPKWKQQMSDIYPYLPTLVLVCVMLAMGCSVKITEVLNHYRHPVGIAIGACSQFILFPLVAFGLAHAINLSTPQALGFLITACSPGGTTSNIYTYYVDGDLPLSICMTVTATVLSLGMMPLNLFIYSRSWTSDTVKMPFKRIAITLASILVPVAVGMLIHCKLKKISRIITKIGAVMGMSLIVVITVIQAILYPYVFTAWWQVWVVSIIFPYLGFFIGYLFAFICRRKPIHCRTIAIETGIQNMGVTFTVIALSYKGVFAAEANVIPILTGIFVCIGGISCVLAYRSFLFIKTKMGLSSDMELQREPEMSLDSLNDDVKYPTVDNSEGSIRNGETKA